jgi:hypothetical protein
MMRYETVKINDGIMSGATGFLWATRCTVAPCINGVGRARNDQHVIHAALKPPFSVPLLRHCFHIRKKHDLLVAHHVDGIIAILQPSQYHTLEFQAMHTAISERRFSDITPTSYRI